MSMMFQIAGGVLIAFVVLSLIAVLIPITWFARRILNEGSEIQRTQPAPAKEQLKELAWVVAAVFDFMALLLIGAIFGPAPAIVGMLASLGVALCVVIRNHRAKVTRDLLTSALQGFQ